MKKRTFAIFALALATASSLFAGPYSPTAQPVLPHDSAIVLAGADTLALETDAEKAVHQLIEDLIQAGTTFDTAELDRIYHNSMQVTMIDLDNNVMKASKADFVGMFENMKASGNAPLNTWAQYNDLTVDGETASVLITRKVNLTGADQILVLNIDLVFEDNRWQVTRETIFARPDDAA